MKFRLDSYDVRMINCLKVDTFEYEPQKLKPIWADRCGIAVEHVQDVHLVKRLAQIVEGCHLADLLDIITLHNPARFTPPWEKVEPKDYWLHWLETLAGIVRNAQWKRFKRYLPEEEKALAK